MHEHTINVVRDGRLMDVSLADLTEADLAELEAIMPDHGWRVVRRLLAMFRSGEIRTGLAPPPRGRKGP